MKKDFSEKTTFYITISFFIGIFILPFISFFVVDVDELNPFNNGQKVEVINQSSSSSYSSCTSGGAKSVAVDRLNSTIGTSQFLDLHKDDGDSWLFYGSVYSSQYSRDVTVFILIGCSDGSYIVENVDVQL